MRHEASEQFEPPAQLLDPDEARCLALAAVAIGDDCRKGLEEVRRLFRIMVAASRIETSVLETLRVRFGLPQDGEGLCEDEPDNFDYEPYAQAERESSELKDASAIADECCARHGYALRYAWNMPIRKAADIGAKARLAVENADYDRDDFTLDAIMKQIADFTEQEPAQ